MNNLNFGQALEALKQGKSVARTGWNGSGMFAYLNPGAVDGDIDHPALIGGVKRDLFETWGKGIVTRMPNFYLKGASGAVSTWVPSITDALAEDWLIVQ